MQTSEPLVSLILLVTEPAGPLRTALASLLGQSWHRTESIVVLPAASAEEIDGALYPSHETPLILEAPDGSTRAELLALGVARAAGELVTWLTPQDAWDPLRIERQLRLLGEGAPDRIVCSPGRSLKPGTIVHSDAAAIDDLPWALLDGRLDPRSLLVPRRCLEEVGGIDASFDPLWEHHVALKLAGRFDLVLDPQPLLRRGRTPRSGKELQRLWRLAVETACAAEPGQRGLAQAYRAAREMADEAAERYVLDVAAHQAVAENVTVVRFQDPGEDNLVTRGPAGETVVRLPKAGEGYHVVTRALEAANSPWLMIAADAEIRPPVLVGQVLAAAANDLDACLPCADPVVIEDTTGHSLIPGTLFRASALRSTCDALAEGDAQFWNAFANSNRIGALPGEPPPPADNSLVNALVNAEWYRSAYPDVAAARVNPIWHYFTSGWREGRDPNAWFSTRWYIEQIPELKDMHQSPLHHFVREGAHAGCRPHPDFDVAWYSREYLGLEFPSHVALRHFLTIGEADGLSPAPPP